MRKVNVGDRVVLDSHHGSRFWATRCGVVLGISDGNATVLWSGETESRDHPLSILVAVPNRETMPDTIAERLDERIRSMWQQTLPIASPSQEQPDIMECLAAIWHDRDVWKRACLELSSKNRDLKGQLSEERDVVSELGVSDDALSWIKTLRGNNSALIAELGRLETKCEALLQHARETMDIIGELAEYEGSVSIMPLIIRARKLTERERGQDGEVQDR